MFRCLECGNIFEDGEQKRIKECMGDSCDVATYQEFDVCPCCGGDFETVVYCDKCGRIYNCDDVLNGLCKDCIAENTTVNECYKAADGEDEQIKINAFLAEALSKKEIEKVLLQYLINNSDKFKEKVKDFVNEDVYWYVERMAEINESK
nr:MAG TPA: rubredoxin iron binding domains containing a [Caudoviricetes sp.]